MVRFTTKRLTGRIIMEKDEAAVIEILTDPVVKKTYMLPDFPTKEDAGKLFRRLRELSQGADHYVVAICLNDTLIGWVNDTEQKDGRIEVGYVLHPRYHNQGYMTEALQAVITNLQAQGYEEVTAGAFEENLASIRVMEKCGMTRQAHQDEIEYRGKAHRCVYYGKILGNRE